MAGHLLITQLALKFAFVPELVVYLREFDMEQHRG